MADKKIGDRVFKVDAPLALIAIQFQARVMQALAPSFEHFKDAATAIAGNRGQITEAQLGGALLPVLNDFFTRNSPAEVGDLAKTIVEMAKVSYDGGKNYDPVDLDGDFTGRLGELLPVCAFVVQEVLGDFFSGLGQSGSRPKKPAQA